MMYHDTACAPAIWEMLYLPRYCCLSARRCLRVANLDDEEWARSILFSAPRVGSFDILFVGGHEAVCAVAVEAPPPIPRPRFSVSPLDLSDACPALSAEVIIEPHAWHSGAMAVLLACRMAARCGWMMADA